MEQGVRRTAKDVSSALSERIAAGEWAGVGRLPGEAELAAECGVARETLRKALRELRDAGLVSNQQGRGWFLGADSSALPADVQAKADELRKQIERGDFDGYKYFPSESKLSASFGFTRHKVRKVIAELEKSGHLRLERGNGRVVEKPKSGGAERA
jgi:DNA-binding GntR family transcriptional regulator